MYIPTISILITGSEILDSRVPDTNSHLIIERVTRAGFAVRHTLSCGDNPETIATSITFLLERSDAVILSGGMGPTSDDLTREVVAELAGVSLELREEALKNLMALYASRGRAYDKSNDKQAMFPVGSEWFLILWVSAGFLIELSSGSARKPLIALAWGSRGASRHA